MCEATLDANERLFCGVILSGSFTIMQKRKDIILFDDKIRISWHFKSSKRQFQTKIIFLFEIAAHNSPIVDECQTQSAMQRLCENFRRRGP